MSYTDSGKFGIFRSVLHTKTVKIKRRLLQSLQ
jgi:hypothetical protein